MNVLLVVVFVAVVNGACMFSFSRAEKALRELGAAWVRALSTARIERPAPGKPPEPDDGLQVAVASSRSIQRIIASTT